MKFVKHYSLQIYSVILILLLGFSAIFVTPDLIQQLALAFAVIALLHEWEEDVYPGGFFDVLFGDIIGTNLVPSHEKQRQVYIYPNILCLAVVFLGYFGHAQAWLITPAMWLGFIEGLGHGIMIPVFTRNLGYNPGKVTGTCFAVMALATLVVLAANGMAAWWQYLLGLLITLALFAFMQQGGMRANGARPADMPKMMRARLKEVRAK